MGPFWPGEVPKFHALPDDIQRAILGYGLDIDSLHRLLAVKDATCLAWVANGEVLLAKMFEKSVDARLWPLAYLHYEVSQRDWWENESADVIYEMWERFSDMIYTPTPSSRQARDMLRFYKHVEFFASKYLADFRNELPTQNLEMLGHNMLISEKAFHVQRALYQHDILLQASATQCRTPNWSRETAEQACIRYLFSWSKSVRIQFRLINWYLHRDGSPRLLSASTRGEVLTGQ
ncbi:hypothetical protein BO94DRAFT_595463 [Aspergillus sclerotioniger CBS 115572]|uniref:Uncharacterized protein n=1 Tax=Aspergillus sclerotioniger CBS 115572 TaxID=1450535 RepID=A0A317WNE6_9EURO|nr:hypothetical protein BO94DRAFT_595463 [Aspergillus sclerotioniger CBS 115572]PWY87883.1 hypothetical protein BO94DRAFT_595463 [Aspergillus sclerotioniger CBS 115572]